MRKKNPFNANFDRLYLEMFYIPLLARAIAKRDGISLAEAITYYKYNGKTFCWDCNKEIQNCQCEYCPECKFNRCLCDLDKKTISQIAWEVAEKTLNVGELDMLQDEVDRIFTMENRKRKNPTKYKTKNPDINLDALINKKVQVRINYPSQYGLAFFSGLLQYNKYVNKYTINLKGTKSFALLLFLKNDVINIEKNIIDIKVIINDDPKSNIYLPIGKYIHLLIGSNNAYGLLQYNKKDKFYYIKDDQGRFFIKFFNISAIENIMSFIRIKI